MQESSSSSSGEGLFPLTRWSVIARSRDSREEFGELLQRYRAPLERFAQSVMNFSSHDAEDAVSDLYEGLMEADSPLMQVHPARGRFRSWLVTCLKHEIFSRWRKRQAIKRGGGQGAEPLEGKHEETVVGRGVDPAVEFDRAFAQALMSVVTKQFLSEITDTESLESRVRYIAFSGEGARERQLMEAFGVSRKTVSRYRREALNRFLHLVNAEVSRMVEDPGEVEEELAWIRQCLS